MKSHMVQTILYVINGVQYIHTYIIVTLYMQYRVQFSFCRSSGEYPGTHCIITSFGPFNFPTCDLLLTTCRRDHSQALYFECHGCTFSLWESGLKYVPDVLLFTLGSFHVKSTRKMDTHHRFCRNLVSTYLTLSDELAWNFSPWTCMVSELQAFKISKFGRILLVCTDFDWP